MPGPLSTAWDWATKPLVPPSPAIDRMAQPGLEDSPVWARVKGFGSGALEGLRQQTSPLGLAGMAAMAVPGMGMLRAGRAAHEGSNAVLGLSRGIPGLVPKPYTPAMETLGEIMPDFTPMGGEAMYNIGKQGMQRMAEPTESVYRRVMSTMGPKPAPASPFQQMQQAGAFRGGRTVRDIGNLQQEQPGGLTDALQGLLRSR